MSAGYVGKEEVIARRRSITARRLDKPRLHIVRKLWPGYVALYRSKAGDTIVIKTLDPPPKTRTLRASGGLRKYKRVKYKQHLQEVLIVAKSTKTKNKKSAEVTDDEIDELESVDDLEEEDLEDEDEDEEDEDEDEPDDEDDEDEDDEDEDDDDEEEEPPKKSKKGSKSKKSKTKPRQSRAKANGKVGTAEIAEAAGVDSRTLRMVLRKHAVAKDEETGRYEWPSLEHKTVKKILKWIKAGEAESIKKESLDKLKEKKAKEKDAKAKTKKSGKKGKKKKVVEDEDDE